MEKQIINILSSTKTIAIVGASSNESKDSFKVMKYLKKNGYKVIPINPNKLGKKILGEKVYSNLEEVKMHIDLVDVLVFVDFWQLSGAIWLGVPQNTPKINKNR